MSILAPPNKLLLALPNKLLLDIADCLPRSDQFFLRVNKRLSKLLAERLWKFPIKPIRADCQFTSILVWAASKGNHYIIAELLERGVDPNTDPDNDHLSGMAIFEAASEGHGRVVKQLLVGGANLDARVKDGVHVFSYMAVFTDKHPILDMLLSGDPDIKNHPTKHLENIHKAMHDMLSRSRSKDNYSRIRRNLVVLLKNSANIDAYIDDHHETILHRAVINGHENVVRLILEHGASISVKDSTGKTPLHMAVERLSEPIVRLLVKKRADIRTSSADGTTVLHTAVEKKSHSMVELLIKLGVSPNVKDGLGNTPLHRAAELGLDEIVEELLWIKLESVAANKLTASGQEMTHLLPALSAVTLMCPNTDISATDRAGRTPLHVAGSTITAEKLLKNDADVKATDTAGQTALHVAARRGSSRTARILLKYGADINATDKAGRTALHVAVRSGYDDMARLLIASGSDINLVYNPKYHQNHRQIDDLPLGTYTALTIAVYVELDRMVELLLEHGAAPGQRDLHMAVKHGYYSMVKLLLRGGADINGTDEAGRTALHVAARSGHDDMARLLIASGSTLDLAYHKEYDYNPSLGTYTALTSAVYAGFDSLVKLLLKHGAVPSQRDLYMAVEHGYYSTVKLLLKKGVNINGTDITGWTALGVAVRSGHDDRIVTLLLNNGATPVEQALHMAVKHGYYSTVKLLLEGGADINRTDKAGRTALHVAARRGHHDIARLLIASGSDINLTYQNDREKEYLPVGKSNALTIAVCGGFEGMVELLLKHGARLDYPGGFTRNIDIAALQGFHNIVELLWDSKYSIQE